MSYQVKPAAPSAAFGAGFGQGLSQQIPKEVERYRLSQGLNELAQNAGNMNPLQVLAKSMGIPGITPQGIQSVGELAKQMAQANAASQGVSQNQLPYSLEEAKKIMPEEKVIEPLTSKSAVQETIEPMKPWTREQKEAEAVKMLNANPARYNNNYEKAYEAAGEKERRLLDRSEAEQLKLKKQEGILSDIKGKLNEKYQRFKGDVPSDVYQDVENKAINDVKKGKMSPEEISTKRGDELREIDRQYVDLENIGNWGNLFKSPASIKNTVDALRSDFAKRKDLRNFADGLITNGNINPDLAYSLAYPLDKNTDYYKYLEKLPTYGPLSLTAPSSEDNMKITEKIGDYLSKNKELSPLAFAFYIKRKGFNPDTLFQYLNNNALKLNLSTQQTDQLRKKIPDNPSINDVYLMSQIGID